VPPPPPPPPSNTAGSTYVRWGRTTCPTSAALVYVGTAGGPGSVGNGGNMQCLPSNPQYMSGQYSEASNNNAYISKAEYGTGTAGLTALRILQGQDVPCAVCKRVLQDSRSMMLPGRQQCPSGFSADYAGFLFAPLNSRGEYICLDSTPEGVGNSLLEGGFVVSPVEAGTGSAAPPYYAQGYELTCVQCGSTSSGSVYTRWGRSDCPSGASLVYAGLMGGSNYNSGTGGSNYLCLSNDPQYQNPTALSQNPGTSIYRTEYETSGQVNTYWNGLQNYEAPCAVCQVSSSRGYSFMQPGRTSCPSGFTLDYQGLLMTMRSSFQRTSYICVDSNAQGVGSSLNENGNLLYMVQTASSNNAPMGFNANYEVSCSHCTVSDSTGGSVYPVWGSQTCPSTSSLVYTGQAAGSASSGGGMDILCLPMTPVYGVYSALASSNGYLYAADYQTATGGVRLLQGLSGGQVPCALCQRPSTRSYSVITPASTSCPAGFALDYQGFLLSAPSSGYRSSYICVTQSASFIGSRTNSLGALLTTTQSNAPLPRGYMVGYEMPCTVCSGYKTGFAPPPPPPPPPPTADMSQSGAVYVRWGRTTCPASATLVYVGITGSSRAQSTGSGANLLCLPPNPQYAPGQYSDVANTEGYLYRAEYATGTSGLPSFQSLNGDEIPCAVCNRQTPSAKTLMIPGQFTCPNGFLPDYQGYLFAPPTSSSRGQYVCMDRNAEGAGSTGTEGGHQLSPVEATTTGNTIEGYNQGYELSCVVCGSQASGSIYTRWGRSTCPSSNSVVYTGRMAGQSFNSNGGGAGYLCLSPNPGYLDATAGSQSPSSALYEVEYETANTLNQAWTDKNNFEAPCVICQSPSGMSYSFVQPGRATCPSGFTTDYQGYLMTAHTSHMRTSFVCVDQNAETIGDSLNLNGALLYFIQTTSDVRAPMGYTNGYEVSCSHCTASSGGSVFVDWGATTCPSASSLVYSGQSAGAYYNLGGGHEYICLPSTPGYLLYNPSASTGAYIYATEYETANGGVAALRGNIGGQVPCAVCQRTGGRPASLMIPAMTSCPLGFAVDYYGYLVSPADSQGKGEYVCLTASAQYIGNKAVTWGSVMYEVEGRSPLPPGYYTNYEISCTICSACSGNSFVSASGVCTVASPCGFGQYATSQPTANANRVCAGCPVGTYQSSNSFTGSACTTCSGSYQNEQGQSGCKSCTNGNYLSSSSTQTICPMGSYCTGCQQTLCSPGTYQPAGGQSACTSCPSNRFQDENGQIQCKACTPGTYTNNLRTLLACPQGSQCINCQQQQCAAGSFQASASQSACVGCSATQFQNEQGTTACKSCTAGFYRTSSSSQASCLAGSFCVACTMTTCGTNTYQDEVGRNSCKNVNLCAAGTFAFAPPTATSNRVCRVCPSQTFSSSANTLPSCTAAAVCGVGQYQSTPSSTTSDTVCTSCAPNTYQDQTGQTACKPLLGCSPGFYSSSLPANGARVCSSCTAGINYQNEAGFTGGSCNPVSPACTPGTYQTLAPSISANRVCQSCIQPNYQDLTGQTTCKPSTACSLGSYQLTAPSTVSDRVCASCDGSSNYQNELGMTSCKPLASCSASQYISVPSTTSSNRVCTNCRTSCSTGLYLSGVCGGQSNYVCSPCSTTCLTCNGPTSLNCTSCVNSLTLRAGSCISNCGTTQFSSGTSCVNCVSPCVTCTSATACLSCNSGVLTNGTCSSTCPSGSFMQSTNGVSRCVPCTSCGAGTFQLSACTPTQDTNCRTWASCLVGQMQSVAPTLTSDRQCVRCNVPTEYQDLAGQIICKPTTDCQPGQYVSNTPTASTDRSCLLCRNGTAQSALNQGSCLACATGQYQSQPGQPGCLNCPADSYQSAQGASACLPVSAGYYRSNDGSSRLACSPGYSCPGGATPPQPCDGVSFFQDLPLSVSCKPVSLCAAGLYQIIAPSPINNRNCSNCPAGSFNNQGGNTLTACTPFSVCGVGVYQSFNGSRTSDIACAQCSSNTYQDETGTFKCKPVGQCLPGSSQIVPPSPATNRVCQSCVVGVNYQDQTNALSCTGVSNCQPGAYQTRPPSLTSDTGCAPCPNNQYQNEAGLPSCKPLSVCQPGQYMSVPASPSSDRTCTACPASTFQPATATATSCRAFTVCGPGSFVTVSGTPSSDAFCGSCVSNSTYQNEAGASACKPLTLCVAGERQSLPPSLQADRQCQSCPDDQYQDAQVTYSGSCKPVRGVCPIGYAQNIAPSPSNDRSCVMCDGVNFYSDQPNQMVCKTASDCADNQYIARELTPFSDRVCADCLTSTDCRASQVLTGACNGSTALTSCSSCFSTCATCNDTSTTGCLACITGLVFRAGSCLSSCAPGEYSTSGTCRPCDQSCVSCTAGGASGCSSCSGTRFLYQSACLAACPRGTFANAADNTCTPCTQCAFGTYASANCSILADTSCSPWSSCPAGKYELTAPTPLTNRICGSCNGVTNYQDQVGQYSCKFATVCTFPNVQGLAPTPTSDRLCICDQPTCRDQVQDAYSEYLCTAPTTTQLASSVSDCCAGTTTTVLAAILTTSDQYTARHECPGCTNNCSCLAGYYQQQSSAGSTCNACDGVTSYAPQQGLTACLAISSCTPGSVQIAAPTSSSNRICSQCAAGTTDIAGTSQSCSVCPPGNYVPSGSTGPCNQYACPGGSFGGVDASTPCSPCAVGTFQPLSGQTFCNASTVCSAGYEEFVMPSPVSNRFCRACISGYTFKAQVGQSTQCVPVSHCGVGEEELLQPTLTSDRVCQPCPAGSYKNVAGDFSCTAVTQCTAGQEEVLMPTAISNRICRSCVFGVSFKPSAGQGQCQPVTPCTGEEYTSVAPTVSSDRVCTSLTNCLASQYQLRPSTVTSNRLCGNCTVCPQDRFQIRQCSYLQNTECFGCSTCANGQFQQTACTKDFDTFCANCSTCEEGFYQIASCTLYSNTRCRLVSRCRNYQYISVPASAVSDVVCRNYTICRANQYVFVRETESTDAVCSTYTQCSAGSHQVVAPGPYSDRVCASCSAGTTDVDANGSNCLQCAPGAYVPVASSGPCSQYLCSPGTQSADPRAATPCTPCNYTNTYQPLAGQTSCLPVIQCAPGYQEVAAPTLFTNRVCYPCVPGYSFKAEAGSNTQCSLVTSCTPGEQYMISPPSISADRVCGNLTVCSSEQYQTRPATDTSNRACAVKTVCNATQYEAVASTATSDRTCLPYINCTSLQYEAAPATPTSNRVCLPLTTCNLPAYETVAATATSNSVCNQSFSSYVYFSGEYSTLVGTQQQQNQFIGIFNQSMVDAGISASAMVGATLQPGSILLIAYMQQFGWRTDMYRMILSGNFSVMGTTALLCPTSHFLVLPIDNSGTVRCDAITPCPYNTFQYASPTYTSDAVCRVLTLCANTAVDPTPTSDRVCNSAPRLASTSDSSSSISPIVLIIIIVLIVLVLALVIGLLLVHRRRRKDRELQEMEMDQSRIRETNRTFADGNALLSQLNKSNAMQFNNPIFAGQPAGQGYLDVAPTPEWMAGQLTREQAEAYLSSKVVGGFIVRASSATGCFVLSMKVAEGEYEHHRLQNIGTNFTINGKALSTPCPTIYDVLDHLSQNPEGISCCIAYVAGNSYGVKKDEDPNFYGAHGGDNPPSYGAYQPWLFKLGRREATEKLLLTPTKGHFLIRESESKPGNYAVSVVISSRDVEHHVLIRGADGSFLLNDKPMSRRCPELSDVVQHLSSNRESMTTTLNMQHYGTLSVIDDDMYSRVRESGKQDTLNNASLSNPVYFQGSPDPGYDHITPVTLPGEISMPQYFDPSSRSTYDHGYLSVAGAELNVPAAPPVIQSDEDTHPYQYVDDASVRRKRETLA